MAVIITADITNMRAKSTAPPRLHHGHGHASAHVLRKIRYECPSEKRNNGKANHHDTTVPPEHYLKSSHLLHHRALLLSLVGELAIDPLLMVWVVAFFLAGYFLFGVTVDGIGAART